jgi:nucleotide-binding universal stress UspA family protein
MFRRIVVALRFNRVGRFALEKSVELAREHGARLLIFHALDYRLMHPETPEDNILELTKSAQQRFEVEMKPLLGGLRDFAFNCWEADPSTEVCRLARDTKADLVVLGCHQSASGKSVSRIGAVGAAILESAPCPVLLIPCPASDGSQD